MIIDKIKEIIMINLDISEVSLTPELNLKYDLELMDLMEVIISIEEEFNIKIKDEELEKIITLEELYLYVYQKLSID